MKPALLLKLLQTMRQLRERERWNVPELRVHQANALRELRAHAYAHSPFYQRFHRGLTERPLEELPVLTKSLLVTTPLRERGGFSARRPKAQSEPQELRVQAQGYFERRSRHDPG